MKLQQLVKDLNEGGLTETSIAQKTGATQSSINRIKSGRTSSRNFELGLKILELHREHFPDRHAG
jgi:predicted transcriptional regulator